jgi:hypothetical protein
VKERAGQGGDEGVSGVFGEPDVLVLDVDISSGCKICIVEFTSVVEQHEGSLAMRCKGLFKGKLSEWSSGSVPSRCKLIQKKQ